MKKMNIMFLGAGNNNWVGGLYYVKNMIFALAQCKEALDNINIFIYIDPKNKEIFEQFNGYENIYFVYSTENLIIRAFNRMMGKTTNNILGKNFDIQILYSIYKYKIDYIFPVLGYPYVFCLNKCICWIADFQHIHYPEFFSKRELYTRNRSFKVIAKTHKALILSSNDAYNDYMSLFPQKLHNVYVVPFVSAIDRKIIQKNNSEEVIKKFNIPSKYYLISNQFWMHKNHITVFKALNILVNEKNHDIHLACTGNTKDYRNNDFFSDLQKYINENNLSKYIHILGFINREDQLALMKGAVAVVQPSLFEGWGTVVEDAKTLQKPIIMSDIKVHNEQKYSKSVIFPKLDYTKLAVIMAETWDEKYETKDNINCNDDFIQMAKVYGMKLYSIIMALQ